MHPAIIGVIASSGPVAAAPPPPSPPFSPFVWLDGDDNSTFTLTGTDIDGWLNKGTGGGTFTPINASLGTRVSDGAQLVNPDKTGSTCTVLQNSFPAATTETWTTFAVISGVGYFESSQAIMTRSNSGVLTKNQYMGLQVQYDALSAVITDGATFPAFADSGPAIDWSSKIAVNNIFGASIITASISDGAVIGTAAKGSSITGSSIFTIGGIPTIGGINQALSGTIHEIIQYDSEMSPADITTVYAYLDTKWGL